VPPKEAPDHDPREDIDTMFEDGTLGPLFIMLVGGIEWLLLIGDDSRASSIRRGCIRGSWAERIPSVPFSEYRRIKYPEKWLDPLKKRMDPGCKGEVQQS
jgi:hypothetical protein